MGGLVGSGLGAVHSVPVDVLVAVIAVRRVGVQAPDPHAEPPAAAARAGHLREPVVGVPREDDHQVEGVPHGETHLRQQRPGEVSHPRSQSFVEAIGEQVVVMDALGLAGVRGVPDQRQAADGRHVDESEPPRSQPVEPVHLPLVTGQHGLVQEPRARPVRPKECEQVIAAGADEEERLGEQAVDLFGVVLGHL